MRAEQHHNVVLMYPKVRYELQAMEQLLEKIVLKNTTLFPLTDIRVAIRNETARTKQAFIFEVFSLSNEHNLTRYIRFHQDALIMLMDKTSSLMQAQEKSQRETNLSLYYASLEELLMLIERHFAKYFDQDVKAPEGYITNMKKEARVMLFRFHRQLAQAHADPHLTDCILHVFKKILQANEKSRITYRNVLYLREVQKELNALLTRPLPIQDIHEELRQIMWYLNYNAAKVFTYYTAYINQQVQTANTPQEKIEQLSFIQKKLNQLRVKPNLQYNPETPSLKSLLNNYLSEELDYLVKVNHGHKTRLLERPLKGFKLKSQASVSQVAYMLRVLMETNILLNENVSEIMAFVVQVLNTPKSESISYSSIRSKYYDVESGTKESVRKMLLEMVKHIDNH